MTQPPYPPGQQPTWPPPPSPPRPPLVPPGQGRQAVLGIAVMALVVAAIVVAVVMVMGDDESDTASPAAAPPYTVIKEDLDGARGVVDLLMPGATTDTADAAIRDYARSITGSPRDVAITVVRSASAKVYVCMGRWVKDQDAAKLYTGGMVKSSTWPAIAMNCPDPAGG